MVRAGGEGGEGLQGKAGVGLEGIRVGFGGGQAGEAGGSQPIPYRLAPRAGLFQLITQRHEFIDLGHDPLLLGEG